MSMSMSMSLLENIIGQSAGNFQTFGILYKNTNIISKFATNVTHLKGSSETLRGKSPLQHYIYRKPQNEFEWGSYLAGLFEGDGHLSTQYQIVISFNYNDKYLASTLSQQFQWGNVYKVKDKLAYNWIICKTFEVNSFLKLINGHIRTFSKLNQINTRIKDQLSGFCFQTEISTSFILQSWWLAGLSDADGCFYIQFVNKKEVAQTTSPRFHFKISLKERTILDQLKEAIGSNVFTRTHPNGKITYYWSSTSIQNAYKVDKYFNRYSLLSSKFFNYLKWRKCLLYWQNRYVTLSAHYKYQNRGVFVKDNTMVAIQRIKYIKSKMNSGK